MGGVKVKRWGGEEGVWMWVWWGGNCDERKRVRVSKMGWRSTRVTMVNILSWTLMNTFMVVSVRARQDQTPSYEELGEMKKILQQFLTLVCTHFATTENCIIEETSTSHIFWDDIGTARSLKGKMFRVNEKPKFHVLVDLRFITSKRGIFGGISGNY